MNFIKKKINIAPDNPDEPKPLVLKPCPICGGDAVLKEKVRVKDGVESFGTSRFRVCCYNCHIETIELMDAKAVASLWNELARHE